MTFVDGCAHVSGNYPSVADPPGFLASGSDRIIQFGFNCIKLHVSNRYEREYAHTDNWTGTIRNIKDLASNDKFTTVFNKNIDTYFLSCHTFSGSTADDRWRNGATKQMLDIERNEMREITAYLLSTYSGTGKTFILQTTESDWSLMGSFDTTSRGTRKHIERYAALLRARQDGVDEARAASTATNVKVLNMIETNRVFDALHNTEYPRLLNDVLPICRFDALGYTAYETLTILGANEDIWFHFINTRFVPVIRRLKQFGVPVYVSEYGWPEAEGGFLTTHDVGNGIDRSREIMIEHGIEYGIYWQVFDNEEQSFEVPRGFHLVRRDGTVSNAGNKFIQILSGS